MNPRTHFTRTTLFLIPLVLACFALPSATQAAPSPTNVNVVNTPNVNVVNTTASPVPVRDVDNPARQPFQAQVVGGRVADGASTTGDIPITTVPAGKLLIIDYVSVFGRILSGQKLNHVSVINSTVQYGGLQISPQGSNADGSRDYFVASQLVRMDFSHSGVVSVLGERDSNLVENPSSVTFTISGYFVDCPTCAL
jgi:hypothetical protein